MEKTKKGKTFSLRINDNLRDELKRLAEKDGRSLNNYLSAILNNHVKKDKVS